jgi:TolB-like protein/DNA-binding SARP family transcriptional activator/Flp pilus assembly protein TadD
LIELRTFGALDLRGSDGRELRTILAQPKRLALLVYLAAATPGLFQRRDTLLALFWPDRDLAHARAALSRAVHYLRASLGEGVLLSRGDEELGLDPDLLFCDAARFRELLNDDRLVDALEVYRGKFLEGFFVSDAPELERWIETERQQFRASAAAAARSIAVSAEAKGDLGLALHWAKQAASHAPYDESDVRRVLGLLERTGERAAAVEFFQQFSRRLGDELELEPSADTVALVTAITSARQDAAPAPPSAQVPEVANVRQQPTPSVPPTRPRLRARTVALALLPVFALGATLVWSAASHNAPDVRERPSIAVLPLVNLGPDSGNQYFSDGMTHELIAALSQVEGLRVAARTSSFAYKNKNLPVKDIARALHVDAVLEGSARREGNQLRITLQLVRAPEGYSLWSKTYDRERRDVFALPHEISRDVADALKVRFVQASTPAGARTTDPETYDLYLWGRYHWNSRTQAGLVKAVQFFERAAARDSSYAPAYSGLADSYNLLVVYDQPPRAIMPKAKTAALRALELDETQSEAHAALADVATWFEWDWGTAERHFRRALELNPSNATAHHWYSIYLSATGRAAESLAEMDRARELDPASLFLRSAAGVRLFHARKYPRALQLLEPSLELGWDARLVYPWLALAYMQLGRVDEAIALLERPIAQTERRPAVLAVLAMAYGAAGRGAEARALVQTLETRVRQSYFPRTWLVRAHVALGDKPRALMWLERAYEERDGWLTFAKVDPTFDALREESRFRAILAKMGLE